MADKSLKYFMQDTAKESEIVEVPGLERFKDGEGKVIPFKIKVLTQEEITTYFNEYKKKTMVFDRKGVPMQRATKCSTGWTRTMRELYAGSSLSPSYIRILRTRS